MAAVSVKRSIELNGFCCIYYIAIFVCLSFCFLNELTSYMNIVRGCSPNLSPYSCSFIYFFCITLFADG